MKLYKIIASAGMLILALAGYFYWSVNYSDAPSIRELASQQVTRQATFSDTVIPESDLPPEGTRSLFDHLIAVNDGVPYPFSKLIALLRDQSTDNREPLKLLIPHGRSLLKGQADDAHPRIVVAADFQNSNPQTGLGLMTQGQLFLGFVENANEIEVVSYNEAAGRFEFQLIKNYCEGCVPRLVYANRAICTTCHQGGTPIFSQRPWNETNGQLATAEAIREARGSEAPYASVALSQPLATPERFDELTDIGNFYLASQHLWLDGCGEKGNECRRKMLSLAMHFVDNPGHFDPASEASNELRKLQALAFPAQGIQVAESDLLNRDPTGETLEFKDRVYEFFTRDIQFGEGAKDNEDLAAFDKLPPLRPQFDPLTVRPPKTILNATDIDGVYGLARFFTEADVQQLNHAFEYDINQLVARVGALPDTVFDPVPFSRVRMMRALLGQELTYCCLSTAEMSPPLTAQVPPLTISSHPELNPFQQYCFACHRGNPSKRLNFMGAETESEVLASIRDKAEIRDVLDWERYEGTDKANKLMPPRDSQQYQKLKQAGADVRADMRETVPSLFSF
ncbi:MAG: hypothetical protein H7A00_07470 [Hahellaceae bacterium]|nr:hypothetical protein [Hahellaceae bacterium]